MCINSIPKIINLQATTVPNMDFAPWAIPCNVTQNRYHEEDGGYYRLK